ncbi:MAG: AAA family ATPase [Caldilineaceae bacterium]
MQRLPIGVQSFRNLREENNLYVDKTRQIYDLLHTGKFVFLSRPRRFGKSLLTTTLQELFRGDKALFAGLWIEDQIDWQPRPVILINFNDLNYLEFPLATALDEYMDRLALDHGVELTAPDYKTKFQELIARLSQQAKVVLLVDEYDKAITDLLENEEKVQEHVATLKNFYSVLKSTASDHLHFVLLTGVSKYGKISIFSDSSRCLRRRSRSTKFAPNSTINPIRTAANRSFYWASPLIQRNAM